MPRYDFRCPRGHVTEQLAARDTRLLPCEALVVVRGDERACGLEAARVAVPSRLGITGFVVPPIRERGIPLGRLVEAHDTMVDAAERAHVEPPNVLKLAKKQAALIKKHRPDLLGEARPALALNGGAS